MKPIRAVWQRIGPILPGDVERLADAWAAAGINTVLPETVYASQAIIPDPPPPWRPFPWLGGRNLLAEIIEACEARDIVVHAWVHTLLVGIEGSEGEPPLIAGRHPDWLARTFAGATSSPAEPGYQFLSPALPSVAHALSLLCRRLSAYPLHGIQLDYIRHAGAVSREDWMDANGAALERFRAETGQDADPSPGTWAVYTQWRRDRITGLLETMRGAVLDATDTPPLLSVDVYPDPEDSRGAKGADWPEWCRRGLVDAVYPMIYTPTEEEFRTQLASAREATPDAIPLVAGIGSFLRPGAEVIERQLASVSEAGCAGACFFNWESLGPGERAVVRNWAAGG